MVRPPWPFAEQKDEMQAIEADKSVSSSLAAQQHVQVASCCRRRVRPIIHSLVHKRA